MNLVADRITVLRGVNTLVNQVSCRLAAGELLGICGPNGAGKSTLLRCMAGLERPTTGYVQLNGRSLAEFGPRDRAIHIGYLPQHPTVAWPLTVTEVAALGRTPYRLGWRGLAQSDTRIIAHTLHDMSLSELAYRQFSTLSGGEQMRGHLARLVAGEHPIVLADEPIASLDPRYQLEVMSHLKRISSGGTAVAVVLHDLPLAVRFCSRILVLDQGALVADAEPNQALSDEVLVQVFDVRALRDPATQKLLALSPT